VELELKHGTCLLDDEDFERLANWRWWSVVSTRQRRMIYVYGQPAGPKVQGELMHRVVLGIPLRTRGFDIDHINRNGLDNRKDNLRVATRAQNLANTGPRVDGRPKGVTWDKQTNRWKASITIGGRPVNLGRFADRDDAARAYNAAALEAWGEFAYLNPLPEDP
jgi:GH18 family chitinase